MRAPSSRFCQGFVMPAVLGLLFGVWQPACHLPQKPESKTEAAQAVQPGMFTLNADQLSHLKTAVVGKTTWAVAVHTTGTVDWDADHTTQAITQVNGPIARILVDTGAMVHKGDPLLYVSSPDIANAISSYKKARNQQNLAKLMLDRSQVLFDRGAIAQKDLEAAQATYNDSSTDVQNNLQALRIFE